jgi:hypothetical protein
MILKDLIILTVYAIQTDTLDQPTATVLNNFNEEAQLYHKTPKQFGAMVIQDALDDLRVEPNCYGNYSRYIESIS